MFLQLWLFDVLPGQFVLDATTMILLDAQDVLCATEGELERLDERLIDRSILSVPLMVDPLLIQEWILFAAIFSSCWK